MVKFKIERRYDLGYLGEDWKRNECFLLFNPLTVREQLDFTDSNKDKDKEKQGMVVVDMLKEKFITGKGINDKGEVITIAKDDFMDFSVDIVTEIVRFLSTGQKSPD